MAAAASTGRPRVNYLSAIANLNFIKAAEILAL